MGKPHQNFVLLLCYFVPYTPNFVPRPLWQKLQNPRPNVQISFCHNSVYRTQDSTKVTQNCGVVFLLKAIGGKLT